MSFIDELKSDLYARAYELSDAVIFLGYELCVCIADNADFVEFRKKYALPHMTVFYVKRDGKYLFFGRESEGEEVKDMYTSVCNLFEAAHTGYLNQILQEGGLEKDVALLYTLEEFPSSTHSSIPSFEYDRALKALKAAKEDDEGKALTKQEGMGRKYKTIDGKLYTRTYDRTGRDIWCPVREDVDSTSLFLDCVFGGFLGLHKFKEGRIFQGILYLLTCGCFGFGAIIDALGLMTGSYRLKDGSFLLKAKVQKAPLYLLLGIGIAIFAFLIYVKVLSVGVGGISGALSEGAQRSGIVNRLINAR